MEEEGGARRGQPAASGGRTEEEAGTESSEEEEVMAAQREEGRRGRTGAGDWEGSGECVTVSGSDRGDGGGRWNGLAVARYSKRRYC